MRQTTFSRRWTVTGNWQYFVDKILAFKAKKPIIPPMIFPFTLKRLVSDDFYLWEWKCWNFLLRSRRVKHFADRRTAVCSWCENSKKCGKTERGMARPWENRKINWKNDQVAWIAFLSSPGSGLKQNQQSLSPPFWFVWLLFHTISELIHSLGVLNLTFDLILG